MRTGYGFQDEICGEFDLKRYSSAGSVEGKVKARLTKEREFRKRAEKIKSGLHKRQTLTSLEN